MVIIVTVDVPQFEDDEIMCIVCLPLKLHLEVVHKLD